MFSSIVHFAQTQLVPLGSLGVFLGAFISEIVGPFPSMGMILGASFSLVEHLKFSLYLIFKIFLFISIPEAIGLTLGSYVMYSLGYFGGKASIDRWGKYFGITWNRVENFQTRMQKTSKDSMFLFFARAIPIFPNMLISTVCGLLRVEITRYTLTTFMGTLIRAFIYGFIGWSLGRTYKTYSRFLVRYERNIFIILTISAVVFFVWFLIKKYPPKLLITKPREINKNKNI